MNHFPEGITRYLFVVILCMLFFLTENGADSKESPAAIDNPVKEAALTTITLTPKAESRLGIETTPAILKQFPGVLNLGGEIIAIPGRDIHVTAPVAGTIRYVESISTTLVGSAVNKGQEVMRLFPLPPEADIISAEEQVNVKEAAHKVAREQFNREEMLLSKNASSLKAYQDAESAHAAAQGELNAAKARLRMLGGDNEENEKSVFRILSPFNGVIQEVFVGSGQAVSISTPLFKLAEQDPVWVRVPVYVGDLVKIDLGKNALVNPMGQMTPDGFFSAEPVQGPLTSDLNRATSDVFYQVQNEAGALRVGQKVMVAITEKAETDSCVVPYAALVYDIYGGAWVYVKTAPLTYARQRVEVSHALDGEVVLKRGIQAGNNVVVSGVAELFGTEFGGGK